MLIAISGPTLASSALLTSDESAAGLFITLVLTAAFAFSPAVRTLASFAKEKIVRGILEQPMMRMPVPSAITLGMLHCVQPSRINPW